MDTTITAIILALVSSGAFTSVTQYILEQKRAKGDYVKHSDIKTMQNQIDSLSLGVRAILSDRLEHLMAKYRQAEEITDLQYKSLVALHDAYKCVGGNSFIDDEFDAVTYKYKHQYNK